MFAYHYIEKSIVNCRRQIQVLVVANALNLLLILIFVKCIAFKKSASVLSKSGLVLCWVPQLTNYRSWSFCPSLHFAVKFTSEIVEKFRKGYNCTALDA